MAWFSSYNSDPEQHIIDEVGYQVFQYLPLSGSTWTQTVYTVQERYIAMTQAGAVTDAGTLSAANPTWNVTAVPENNGGGWTIRITRQVIGAWTEQ